MVRRSSPSLILIVALAWVVTTESFATGYSGWRRGLCGHRYGETQCNPLGSLASTTESLTEESSLSSNSTEHVLDPAKATTTSSGTRILADSDAFEKPDRDFRQYRMIVLPNNLKVLLVSDNLTAGAVGTEACSVHVQAGHFDDTVAGLAHFHEHMLFLGTEKYPSEDEFEKFLGQAGGYSNAYTDMEDTNYYLSVTTEAEKDGQTTPALAGALDRFAQFFIAPTFDPDAVERELQAIDSEYRNGKTSDAWRNYQFMKNTCDQRHPFKKFGCGNYETLSLEGREHLLTELQRFWDTYYQTYNLRLSVVGHASLDALQATVEETFGNLKWSTGAPRHVKKLHDQLFERENAVYGVPAFGPEQLGWIRKMKPLTESRCLKIYFSTPPLSDPLVNKVKPQRALSHLLGHEAPGSLHALLNDLGYITGLSSGMGIDTSDFALLSMTLGLTPKGMSHKDEVLDLFFQWLALIKDDEHKLVDYHKELLQIAANNFQFRENGDPTDFCSSAAELLFDERTESEPTKFLCEGIHAEFDPVIVRAYLDRLRPDNCMITIINSDLKEATASDHEGHNGIWKTEHWYGAKYKEERISPSQMKAWEFPNTIDNRLHLPGLNQYIPTDFSMRCDDAPHGQRAGAVTEEEIQVPPRLVIDQPNFRLWHKMDQYWRIPKTFIRLAILSPALYRTPRTMTLSRIFQKVLSDDLNSFVYDASVAGCNYHVSCMPSGYRISLGGYSEKLPFLLDTVTNRILEMIGEMKSGCPVLREKFKKAHESLLRETKNYRLDAPYEVANYNSRLLMEESVWYLDNYVDEMEGPEADSNPLTMEECASAAEEGLMGRLKCEALCMGNIDESDCQKVSNIIEKRFLAPSRTLTEAETPSFRSMMLPTRDEAERIFGPKVTDRSIPLICQNIAFSESEENNSVEITLQVGSELVLGYEGVAILDLITHMAYNSAFAQLRTKEQLGYIVSAMARKTAGGTWGMSIIVQSSVALPEILEERCEAWLKIYREELEEMSPDYIASEAAAVAAQLLESERKLGQEIDKYWGEILNTEGLTDQMREPIFDRLERLADVLKVSENGSTGENTQTALRLKESVLKFFDEYFVAESPNRRALSARVYSQNSRSAYEAALNQPGILSSFSDMRHLKQFLSSWPNVPYWRKENNGTPFSR